MIFEHESFGFSLPGFPELELDDLGAAFLSEPPVPLPPPTRKRWEASRQRLHDLLNRSHWDRDAKREILASLTVECRRLEILSDVLLQEAQEEAQDA